MQIWIFSHYYCLISHNRCMIIFWTFTAIHYIRYIYIYCTNNEHAITVLWLEHAITRPKKRVKTIDKSRTILYRSYFIVKVDLFYYDTIVLMSWHHTHCTSGTQPHRLLYRALILLVSTKHISIDCINIQLLASLKRRRPTECQLNYLGERSKTHRPGGLYTNII